MIAAVATLILGFVIGYLGQRSRLCFIAGYRDFFLTHNTLLLKGVLGAVVGALGGFTLFNWLGGSVPGFPLLLPGIIAGGTSFLVSWAMHDRSVFDLPLEPAPAPEVVAKPATQVA